MSHEKRGPGWLGYIADDILPSYIGIKINHYKDPYEATSIMESRKVFFRGSNESRQFIMTSHLTPNGSEK